MLELLIELQIAITMLSINPERAAAAMQNIMTLHLEGGFCDQSDGHAKAREIFAPPDR